MSLLPHAPSHHRLVGLVVLEGTCSSFHPPPHLHFLSTHPASLDLHSLPPSPLSAWLSPPQAQKPQGAHPSHLLPLDEAAQARPPLHDVLLKSALEPVYGELLRDAASQPASPTGKSQSFSCGASITLTLSLCVSVSRPGGGAAARHGAQLGVVPHAPAPPAPASPRRP